MKTPIRGEIVRAVTSYDIPTDQFMMRIYVKDGQKLHSELFILGAGVRDQITAGGVPEGHGEWLKENMA